MEQAWPFATRRYGFLSTAIVILLLAVGCKKDTAPVPPSNKAEPAAPATNDTAPAERAESSTELTSDQGKGPESTAKLESAESSPSAVATDQSASSTGKKEREPLFQGWPKPNFVLLITGQQMGYMEPCGCTGLANQKGGLARRHTLARQLTERGWPVVAIDVGNQIQRFGRQSEIKFQMTVEALKKIGYQAIAFGTDDLRISSGELAAITLAADGGTTPFVCANAAILDRTLTPTHHIVEAGGKKIGITAVLGNDSQSKIIGSDVILTTPEAGLDQVMPQLRNAKCDLLVLLAHASIEESKQLAEKYRDFQVVITAGGGSEPAYQPETVGDHKALFVKVGLKGMFVGVLGFFDDAANPSRYQRIPLDDRFEDSSDMLGILASYQEQLKTLGFEGLDLKPIVHPSGYEFVGSEKCGECHTKAYAVWKDSRHAHATDSLVHPNERSEIPRHFDPECLSCHVTGWNPGKFFPYTSGYLSLEKTPMRVASGCENCHGPGSAHVAAESGEGNPSEAMLAQLRNAMRLRLSNAEAKCMECHDLDNSPDFHEEGAFQKYWEQVKHIGLD